MSEESKSLGLLRAAGVELAGWSLVVGGIIAMPLPGPGTLIFFAGIVLLSQRYRWANKLRERARHGVERATCESVATRTRITFSILSALSFMLVGSWVFTDPTLPEWAWFSLWFLEVGPSLPASGPQAGVPIFLSGLVALILLRYGYVHYGPGTDFYDEHFGSSESK